MDWINVPLCDILPDSFQVVKVKLLYKKRHTHTYTTYTIVNWRYFSSEYYNR